MKTKKTVVQRLAEKHGVTPKTVREWRRQGAPLADPENLSVWLAGRRQPPPQAGVTSDDPDGVGAALAAGVTSAADPLDGSRKTPSKTDEQLGGPAALRRLEVQELGDYRALEAALRDGDELKIRLRRDAWLKTSEALRRADLAIEQDRRAAGDLIPRAEAERCLAGFTNWFVGAIDHRFKMKAPELASVKEPAEAVKQWTDNLGFGLGVAFERLKTFPYEGKPISKWAVDAAKGGLTGWEFPE